MTTVKQLREFLAKLPDDLEVEVLKEVHRGYDTSTAFKPLELFDPTIMHGYSNNCDVIGGKLYLGQQ